MKSIRTHLTLLLLLGLGGLCVAAGWLGYHTVRHLILSEFDYSLRTKIGNFAILSELELGEYEFEFADKQMPEFERIEHPEYFQIMHKSGEVLVRSPSLGGFALSLPETKASATPHVYALTLPGGLPGRAAVVEVVPLEKKEPGDPDERPAFKGSPVSIIVARDTLRLKQVFSGLALGFAIGTLAMLLLMAWAIRLIVKTGLRPLNALAEQAGSIQSGDLDTRFPVATMPVELQPIAEQLNQLLQRMDAAFRRERQITAGMAHELYTPIAELRSLTEVAAKWPDDPEATAAMANHAHAIALQMQDIVNALLSLSRCESGMQALEATPVDVAELLNEVRGMFDEALRSKKINLAWAIDPAAHVKTDRAMLSAVLTNLFKNAIDYTPAAGGITCRADHADEGIVVRLANTNHDLIAEDIPHLFEPLWRKDKARTGCSHCGLGLAVAERFSNLLGIGLSATLPEPGWFEIILTIPLAVSNGVPPPRSAE